MDRVPRGVGLPVELLAAGPASAGQDAAGRFEAFYQREFPGLVALAGALCGPALAEDVAQEAMLVVMRRWNEIEGFDRPVSWARRVCANIATSTVRRRAVEARALFRVQQRRTDPLPDLVERHEAFWEALRGLPRRQAQATALFYLFDLPVVEIAATLGCSQGSVKTHLSRGRTKLALILAVEEADDDA